MLTDGDRCMAGIWQQPCAEPLGLAPAPAMSWRARARFAMPHERFAGRLPTGERAARHFNDTLSRLQPTPARRMASRRAHMPRLAYRLLPST